MRIVTLNANGIRSASSKGLFAWLQGQDADVICLQETRARLAAMDGAAFHLPGYERFSHDAQRPGYSGVAVYTRKVPDAVVYGLGWPDMDAEGRYLEVRFGDLAVASVYVPSGSSSPERQAVKFSFLERFQGFLQSLLQNGRECVLCGDWNIAHRPIDLENWRSNQKNSGFLPEERAWMDTLFDALGFVDAFRVVNGAAREYTWWSNRGQAWAKNVGWRIDYQVVTPGLRERVRGASIYRAARFSDHAPLTIDYALRG